MNTFREIPTSFSVDGNPDLVEPYMGLAKKQVSMLVSTLEHQKLDIGKSKQTLKNGLIIKATVTHGLTYVKFDTTRMADYSSEDDSTKACVRICHSEIEWDEETPAEINKDDETDFTVNKIEFGDFLQVSVTDGAWLDEGKTLTTRDFRPCALPTDCSPITPECQTYTFTVYTDSPCKKVDISVADTCGIIETTVTVPYEDLIWDDDDSAEVVAPNSSATVYVENGNLPLTVSLVGTGFYLDSGRTQIEAEISGRSVTIYTSGDVCGSCDITVSDGCGDDITGELRSTEGEWTLVDGSDCYYYGYSLNFGCLNAHYENKWLSRTQGKYKYKVNWYWNFYDTGTYDCPGHGMYLGAWDSCGDPAGQYREIENADDYCWQAPGYCVRCNGVGTGENMRQGFDNSAVYEWICST